MPSRRAFIHMSGYALAAAVMPFGDWLESAKARAAAKLTRYDVTTAEGQAMLKIYARAVGKMMELSDTDPGNPSSWLFQWYTHSVRGDKTKTAEIERIYSSASDPHRTLAQAMWGTCQAHSDSTREDFFLPWHRLFLINFEEIVRKISEEKDFTLPYWNYTGPQSEARVLPQQFRLPTDGTWKPLFRPDRNPGVNDGVPVDEVGQLDLDNSAMTSIVYQDQGGDAGFCSNLDQRPHGALHDDIGNSFGMSDIAWAANDPIFWLHHSNIDRMWASWNKAGGKNPPSAVFTNEVFTFADAEGKAVQGKVGDVLELTNLNYDYDSYIERPSNSPTPSSGFIAAIMVHAVSRQVSPQVDLGADRKTVTLSTEPSPEQNLQNVTGRAPGTTMDISSQLKLLNPDRVFFLRLNNVTVSAPPGTAYDVYLGRSDKESLSRSDPSYVGSLCFFGVVAQREHAEHNPSRETGRNYSFVVTDLIRKLQQEGRLSGEPSVTFVPLGTPREGSAPKIGSVSLVSS
jgi:tyrosinase